MMLYYTNPDAEKRAMRLLRSCLSKTQLTTLLRDDYFDVVGSRGTHFRIMAYSRIGNIYEFKAGRLKQRWCFGPEPDKRLPLGDILLVQKIALENNENGTLRIAHPVNGYHTRRAFVSFWWRPLLGGLIGAVGGWSLASVIQLLWWLAQQKGVQIVFQ